jgi:hypothetical protein
MSLKGEALLKKSLPLHPLQKTSHRKKLLPHNRQKPFFLSSFRKGGAGEKPFSKGFSPASID